MAAVKQAMARLDDKYGPNNSLIGRLIGVDREKVPDWRDGTSKDMKVIESFASLMEEAEMPLTPFSDARTAILEIFGPWMAKIETDLEALKAQRVQVIVSDTDTIRAATPSELQQNVGGPARRGMAKAMADKNERGETKGRSRKKAAS